MNNLERKIKELDKLITEKVGFSFVKRGERERKREARKRVSGYFTSQLEPLRNEMTPPVPRNPEESASTSLDKNKCLTPHESHEIEIALKDFQMSQHAMLAFSDKFDRVAAEIETEGHMVIQPPKGYSLTDLTTWLKDENHLLSTKLMELSKCLSLMQALEPVKERSSTMQKYGIPTRYDVDLHKSQPGNWLLPTSD